MKHLILIFIGTLLIWLILSRKDRDRNKIFKACMIVFFSFISTYSSFLILDSYFPNFSFNTSIFTPLITFISSQVIAYYFIKEIGDKEFSTSTFIPFLIFLNILIIVLMIFTLTSEYGPWNKVFYRIKYGENKDVINSFYAWTGAFIASLSWFLTTYLFLTKNRKPFWFIFIIIPFILLTLMTIWSIYYCERPPDFNG